MNIGTLDYMDPGTDYHGLIKRVAYKVWENCHNAATDCWKDAKRIVRIVANEHFTYKFGDADSLHRCLQWNAHTIREEQPDIPADGEWFEALDSNADLIMAAIKR